MMRIILISQRKKYFPPAFDSRGQTLRREFNNNWMQKESVNLFPDKQKSVGV